MANPTPQTNTEPWPHLIQCMNYVSLLSYINADMDYPPKETTGASRSPHRSRSELARMVANRFGWYVDEWDAILASDASTEVAYKIEALGRAMERLGWFFQVPSLGGINWFIIPKEAEAITQIRSVLPEVEQQARLEDKQRAHPEDTSLT